jgi:Uma2 family endonuclease
VEILSPSNRQYERLGVAEYWIVDPDASAARICRRSAAVSRASSQAKR